MPSALPRPALAALALASLAPASSALAAAPAPVAFDWFEYSGADAGAPEELPAGHYRNPVLSGFYPDPSLCRAGDDYYLVNSTFAYFPGLPIFHSKDLVNWRFIGHAIDRPAQLRYDGLGVSQGIFAPAITHHDGTFYLICTQVGTDGNFIVTAKHPAGPWSDPVRLLFNGIDPSLFFDDDGRAWVVNNDDPEGAPLYDGHRAIRIQEFDIKARKMIGPRPVLVNGGVDLSTKPIWIEGPHLYKREGWYYLSCAEGGTGPGHSQVVFRSRSVTGPYEPWEKNPVLTQRGLDNRAPGAVTCVGHADLEIGPDGRWWATFLGVRPYDGEASPMGRETFLLPVEWTPDGWPTILPDPTARVPLVAPAPNQAALRADPAYPLNGGFTWRDDFSGEKLSPVWIMLRSPKETWWTLGSPEGGRLLLSPRTERLSERGNPSYLGRRVQHARFQAATALRVPSPPGVSAGLVAFQNETHHYFLALRRDAEGPRLSLERANGAAPEIVKSTRLPADAGIVRLRIESDRATCSFSYALGDEAWTSFVTEADARLLTTAAAGGFVGATVGPHARAD